jgi:hypothetical protein
MGNIHLPFVQTEFIIFFNLKFKNMTPATFNIIGLVANIIGTIILAFSLSAYIGSMRLAIDAHELYILSVNNPRGPIYQITGTDVHMKRGKKNATFFSWLGVILVVSGFIFQLTSYFIK